MEGKGDKLKGILERDREQKHEHRREHPNSQEKYKDSVCFITLSN